MEPGQLVGERFELGPLAGRGGMGRVYRALDRLTGEAIALKVIDGFHERTLERFGREAMLLAALRHPGIVRYVAHGWNDEAQAWLAMEWLEGEDLRARLAREGMTLAMTVELGRRVADALGAAHARGVVHRDVKPENIFLPRSSVEHVKLLDLGLARLGDSARLTRTDAIVGTPAYMAPEQARGERDLDARADVFALGAVLYECATGAATFAASHVAAVLARVLLEEVQPLAEVLDGVPAALSELVARMLAKDPAQRPRDGAQVAAALRSLAVPSAAAPRAPRSERPPVLTSDEQRLLCVVLGRPRPSGLEVATDSPTVAGTDKLEALAGARGARLTMLADGSLLCTRTGGPGGPVAQAVRAARLALVLREAAPSMPLALATTRASGAVAVGEAVGRAASLLGDSGVSVDEPVARLLEERFELVREGDRSLLGAERAAPPGVRTLLGRPTPCVGRDRELSALEAYLDECIDEPVGRPVLVVAEAGVGKSRLRDELMRRIEGRSERVTVWLGRGDPVSAGSAFGLLGRALKEAAAVRDGAPIEERRERVRAFAGRNLSASEAPRVAEFLGEMLGVPFPDEASVELRAARADARLMADRMRLAFEELVLAECAAGPLVLVLEDLQWGDLPSVSYVDSTLRVLGERPWLVLALARPEVRELFPSLWAERGAQELRLEPLRSRPARALVHAVLGSSASDAVVERIVRRAAGNAFALEELVRAEAEGRGDAVPETVLGLVEARLSQLEPEARRVLRAASVFGETFWSGGVAALLGGSPSVTPAEWLELLAERELVTMRGQGRFPNDRELAFRHALVREASYAMLTDEDRRLGHRLAASWLEEAGETEALVLAEHRERAGEPERAARWYLRAARQALEGDDLEAVLACAARGLACGGHGELGGELLLIQAESHMWRAEFASAADRATEALVVLPRTGPRWLDAAGELANALGRLGRFDALLALAEELLAFAVRPEQARAAAVALARAAAQLFLAARPERARSLVERAEHFGEPLAASDATVAARLASLRANRALYQGDLAEHLRAQLESAACFERAGDLRSACRTRGNAGYALLELGAYARAEALLREVLTTASRMGLRHVRAHALSNLGAILGRVGRLREATELEREAVARFGAQGDRRLEGCSRNYLAEILLAAGALEPARTESVAALALVEGAAPLSHPFALALLARIELARGVVDAALDAAQRARALLEELGALEEGESLVRLAHAEALEAAGRREEARRALVEARRHLLQRAGRITDPELERSFLDDVPENARTLMLARDLPDEW